MRNVNRVNNTPSDKVEDNISERLHSGRPTAGVNWNEIKQLDSLITIDRRMIIAKL